MHTWTHKQIYKGRTLKTYNEHWLVFFFSFPPPLLLTNPFQHTHTHTQNQEEKAETHTLKRKVYTIFFMLLFENWKNMQCCHFNHQMTHITDPPTSVDWFNWRNDLLANHTLSKRGLHTEVWQLSTVWRTTLFSFLPISDMTVLPLSEASFWILLLRIHSQPLNWRYKHHWWEK